MTGKGEGAGSSATLYSTNAFLRVKLADALRRRNSKSSIDSWRCMRPALNRTTGES
jgi:hypothetical protein